MFGIIETGSPAGPRKADGIRNVLKSWPGISPDEVLYVGDAPSDIKASREAGIAVVGAAWASTTDAEALKMLEPDAMFYSVSDFADWLK